MAFVLSILFVLMLLLASEWWWRQKQKVHNEFSRKFVHITVGSFVAFWPYLLTSNQIKIISIAFIVAVLVSKYFKIFQAIHSVQRPTNGELWFATAVGIMAFWVHDPHIFTASLLTMALADGLAAVFGVTYGKKNSYKVFGMKNSYVGTATFLFISYLILLTYWIMTSQPYPGLYMLPIALAAAVIENFGYKGLDNLIVPVFVAVNLSLLS
ncbi:MAG: hypothetical protein WCF91_01645 [bacterium]